MSKRFFPPAGLLLAAASAAAAVGERTAALEAERLTRICQQPARTMAILRNDAAGEIERSPLRFRGVDIGQRYTFDETSGGSHVLELVERAGEIERLVAKHYDARGNPRLLLSMDRDCALTVGRRVEFDADGRAERIVTLDRELEPRGAAEWLNPPLVFDGPAPGPGSGRLRVALVDSGVNYRLPGIRERLARTADGGPVGYDFWDRDSLPFDAFVIDDFFVQRHGTRTASILLREAPAVDLVPYRVPQPDMSRMSALIEHADRHRVAVVGIAIGSRDPELWRAFAEAARRHPAMLFVVSAGNDGTDIDRDPVYPAALDLDNMLVVTSADDFLRPAARVNWGPQSVDYLLPAEQISVLDFDGDATLASGSSYAVPRLVALAARLKQREPGLSPAGLIERIDAAFVEPGFGVRNWVKRGYLPDPRATEPPRWRPAELELADTVGDPVEAIAETEILILDDRWSPERIGAAWRQAWQILSQCGIGAVNRSIRRLDGPDYLRDLTTGHAHTLFARSPPGPIKVVLSRDTRMLARYTGEAFGEGNTRRRPWLRNSLWLVHDIDDPGVALAHEMFHVLANDGSHSDVPGNLMQGETRPDGTALTAAQCARAIDNGRSAGLLRGPG